MPHNIIQPAVTHQERDLFNTVSRSRTGSFSLLTYPADCADVLWSCHRLLLAEQWYYFTLGQLQERACDLSVTFSDVENPRKAMKTVKEAILVACLVYQTVLVLAGTFKHILS